MRHRKSLNHLGRKAGHRKAMLANMASSLIKHKRITTTTAKAKALRTFVEPLITRSKEDTTHSRRVVFSYLQDKDAVSELFREVAGKVADRPGGYTRILKLGNREGDSAEMAIIELVDYNPNLLGEGTGKAGGRKRRRGGKKKAEGPQAVSETQVPDADEEEAKVIEETGAETKPAEDQATETTEATAEAEAARETVTEAPAETETPAEAEAEAPAEAEIIAEEKADDVKDEAAKEETKEDKGTEEDENKKES
jgi:large subunit ribosomal protein L17